MEEWVGYNLGTWLERYSDFCASESGVIFLTEGNPVLGALAHQ